MIAVCILLSHWTNKLHRRHTAQGGDVNVYERLTESTG